MALGLRAFRTRALTNYLRALSESLAAAGDVAEVKALLRHARDLFISTPCDGPRFRPVDVASLAQRLAPPLLALSEGLQDGACEVSALFFATYIPPNGTWPEALLAIVAQDWLGGFSPDERSELFDAFFLTAPPATALAALVSYLSIVDPSGSGSGTGTGAAVPAGGQTAVRLLLRMFVEPTSCGVRDLVAWADTYCEGKEPTVADVAGWLATLVDILPLFNSSPELSPGSLVPCVVSGLLDAVKSLENDQLEGRRGCSIGCRSWAFDWVGIVLERLGMRGHGSRTALGVLTHVVKQRLYDTGDQGWNIGRVIRPIKNSIVVEKLLENILQLMCMPSNIWSDEAATTTLSRLIGFTDAENGMQQPHILRFILGTRFMLKKTLPYAALRWIILLVCRHDRQQAVEVAEMIVNTWCDPDAIRVLAVAHQAYITTALVLFVSQLGEESLECKVGSAELTQRIFEGVSNRLGSPLTAIRHQGMRVAQVVSALRPGEEPLFDTEMFPFVELAAEERWIGAELVDGSGPHQEDEAAHEGACSVPANVGVETDSVGCNIDGVKRDVQNGVSGCGEPDSDDDSNFVSSLGDSLEALDLSEGDEGIPMQGDRPMTLCDLATALRKPEDKSGVMSALQNLPLLLDLNPDELESMAPEMGRALLHAPMPNYDDDNAAEEHRFRAMISLLSAAPAAAGRELVSRIYLPDLSQHQRLLILDTLGEAATRLSSATLKSGDSASASQSPLAGTTAAVGKSRVWGVQSLRKASSPKPRTFRNRFLGVALDWTLGLLQDCGKVRHAVDLFGRDHMVLGRLLLTLGHFAECVAETPVSVAISSATLQLIQAPATHQHPEALVRRSALVAAHRVLLSLPPSRISGALVGGSRGDVTDNILVERLEWLREWSVYEMKNDLDETCRLLGSGCLAKQSELAGKALQYIGDQHDSDPRGLPMQLAATIGHLHIQGKASRQVRI